MDESSVATAYRLYAAALWRRCLTILRNEEASLDVVQEVFIRCLRHRRHLRSGRELLGWLYRVATNLCLNQLRDQRHRKTDVELVEGGEPSRDDEAIVRLIAMGIMRGLDRRSQEVAIYVFVDGMTHAEAAEVAGVSERTVRSCLGEFRQHGRHVMGLRPREES